MKHADQQQMSRLARRWLRQIRTSTRHYPLWNRQIRSKNELGAAIDPKSRRGCVTEPFRFSARIPSIKMSQRAWYKLWTEGPTP
jgi:hypothetical protein